MASREWDVVVIGGGIVGCAAARELAKRGRRVAVLEKEGDLARHASGRNSGVLHSGVFNRPGTVKAAMTARGLPQMLEYCRQHGVPVAVTGKVIAAGSAADADALEKLRAQGVANGLSGLELCPPEQMAAREPEAAPRLHLVVPQAGVVDSVALVRAIAHDAEGSGASFMTGTRVVAVAREREAFVVATDRGEFRAPRMVNAAGLHADAIAWQLGAAEEYVVVPFRGDNFELVEERRGLVRGLLYPLKDPERPFVGVHFTKRTDGGVLVGPNAVIPPGREVYTGLRPRRETLEMAADPAFLRALFKNKAVRRHAPRELLLSLSPRAFLDEARRLVPALKASDLRPTRSGIRAQLVHRETGAFVDDVVVQAVEGAVHVLNAVSPALTNALAFGALVADRVEAA
jgi:L-2-hydroxyglutarate oxidase LhgO